MEPLKLTALVSSRICHDLVSPISAIGNGMELLSLSGTTKGPETDLIQESVDAANAKVRLFRLAFGAGSYEDTINASDLTAMFETLYEHTRMTVRLEGDSTMDRWTAKLLALSLLCLETALPFSGEITFTVSDYQLTVNASSERLQLDADLWSFSETTLETITPAKIQFLLLPLTAKEVRRPLDIRTSDTAIEIRI